MLNTITKQKFIILNNVIINNLQENSNIKILKTAFKHYKKLLNTDIEFLYDGERILFIIY